jgi:hypothetical protein
MYGSLKSMSRYKFIQICKCSTDLHGRHWFWRGVCFEGGPYKRRDGLTHTIGTEVRSATVVNPRKVLA